MKDRLRQLLARLPRPSRTTAVAGGLLLVVALFAGGYALGRRGTPPETPSEAKAKGEAKAEPKAEEKKPQWWTCSMHPQIKQPKPGLCPICNMDLIPLKQEAGGAESLRTFVTSPAAKKLMQIQTSPVERRFVTATVRMDGKVDYDETRLTSISAWVAGRIDRLYVDYTGITVRKGDHMVYLYSPELYAAQEELLQAIRSVKKVKDSRSEFVRETAQATVEATREKLRLFGLNKEQVKKVEQRGTPSDHLTIYAPESGIVIQRHVDEGAYVQTGTKIYTIADLSQVWVKLDAYESDLQWLRYGQTMTFTTEAYPGETFEGQIAFIQPVLNAKTRTVKVRVNVPNQDGRLKPEMFVTGVVHSQVAVGGRVMEPHLAGKWICRMHPGIIKDDAGACDACEMPLVKTESLGYVPINEVEASQPLVIPASAPLITGKRAVVYVEDPEADKPTFVGREIVLGPRAANFFIVRHGLAEGEMVVTHGNFKIDSALQIVAKPSMMTPSGGGGPAQPGAGEEAKLPKSFTLQLREVLAAHQQVHGAVQTGELSRIHTAYQALKRSLDDVDASALSGRTKLLWKEIGMRLTNDAVVGTEIQEAEDAREELTELDQHVARVHEQLGVPKPSRRELMRFDVPKAVKAQLQEIVDAYMALQKALAGDDPNAAKQAVDRLGNALQEVDMKAMGSNAHTAWMRELPSLQRGVKDAQEAEDISTMREAFALLSEELPSIVRMFRLAAEQPLYILQCPMAFDNRGATWLQRDKETRNPYFGSAMLKCGGVVDTLSTSKMPEDEHKHE
jgi:Cu(I)/Ag(I) efflux system membrane fusion protein